MPATVTEHDRIDALFEDYRPTSTDDERRGVMDRIVDAIRDHFASSGEDLSDDDLELSRALDDLQAAGPQDGSYDRQVQDVRAKYRRHASAW